MIEIKNKVSIWFGKFDTKGKFVKYIKKTYNEDGDSIPSQFMKDFKIKSFDEDFLEVFFDTAIDNSSFEDISYSETFLEKIKINFSVYNCTILLYDFSYTGTIKEKDNVKFYGTLDYQKTN